MKRFLIMMFLLTIGTYFSPPRVIADIIPKGTLSLGGSSNIFFRSTNLDHGNDSDTYSLSINCGYFIFDSFEFGTALLLSHVDRKSRETNTYSIEPYISYHFPVDLRQNFYISPGIGLLKSETEELGPRSYSSEGFKFFTELGWEYFLNPHLAMNVGLNFYYIEWKLDGYSVGEDDTETTLESKVGLKAFFK